LSAAKRIDRLPDLAPGSAPGTTSRRALRREPPLSCLTRTMRFAVLNASYIWFLERRAKRIDRLPDLAPGSDPGTTSRRALRRESLFSRPTRTMRFAVLNASYIWVLECRSRHARNHRGFPFTESLCLFFGF